MTHATRRAGHRRPRTTERSNAVLTATGILVALWMGLTAPSISPVAGPSLAAAHVGESSAVPPSVTTAVSLHTSR